ncbi:MAG: hypothetical protein K6U87_11660 [Firmicutes bacterium]|nr:hypothetical protein [Bacillota bacterium]
MWIRKPWHALAAAGAVAVVGGLGLVGWSWAPVAAAAPGAATNPTMAPAMMGNPGGRGPAVIRELGQVAESTITQYLGISPQTLRADRQKGESLADIVASLNNPNITVPGLEQQLTTALTNQINQAVSQGRLSQARASQLEQHLNTMVQRMVTAKPKPGPGHGRPGAFMGPAVQSAITQYLGISPQTLRADRQKGESLADIVASLNNPNITVPGLEQQLTTALTNQINQAVSQGRLSQARASQLEQHLNTMVQRMVTAKPKPWPGQSAPTSGQTT